MADDHRTETAGTASSGVALRPRADGGLTVVDPVERRRYDLAAPSPLDPESVDPSTFRFPVDAAASVEASRLELPDVLLTFVRDATGRAIAEFGGSAEASFSDGPYEVELTPPIKCYLRVPESFSLSSDGDRMTFSFPPGTELLIGARSHHGRPATTITTTEEPEDVLSAISAFSSALKTTSPERSFPTLRGHPPRVELGDELDVPNGLAPPATDLRIEVPPRLEYAYPVAPLAYYLGAPVEPGPTPRIVGDGLSHELDAGSDASARGSTLASPSTSSATSSRTSAGTSSRTSAGTATDRESGSVGVRAFERGVRRTLQRVFLLECLTRTEGLYPIDLHERRAVERAVDLELGELYDAPQSRRLEAFLSVPREAIEPHVPEWPMVAGVQPEGEHVEVLPHLVDDFCLVETRTSTPVEPAAVQNGALHGLVRGRTDAAGSRTASTSAASGENGSGRRDSTGREEADATGSGGPAGSGSPDVRGRGSTDEPIPYVRCDVDAPAVTRTWVGDGMPVDASKALPQAYRNRIGRQPDAGDIEIAVVCNDSAMDAERDAVDETYGDRVDRSFDVEVHRDLAGAEFADVLAADYDLLHYVGHIEDGGVRCSDGLLDVRRLDAVGVDAFVLNACRSYDQGLALVERGAIGGIVTLSDVVDLGAVRIGRDVARLLDCGFPLHAALDVARGASVVGAEYNVVGDGSLTVAQCESGVPLLHDVERHAGGVELTYRTYTPGGVGGVHRPLVPQNDVHYLASGESGTFDLSWDDLRELLRGAESPVRFEGDLYSTDEFLARVE